MTLEWDQKALFSLAARNGKNLSANPDAEDFLKELRAFVPKPGNDWVKAVSVVVSPGKEIKRHHHPEWTVLYYLDPCDTPLFTEEGPHYAKSGEVVVMPPNMKHWVPENKSDRNRISLAMLVEA
jgi:quercetin dioxygenase-like cupin family protein